MSVALAACASDDTDPADAAPHDAGPADSGARCDAADCAPACRISGATFEPGALHPDNPCERCDPSPSASGWTRLADGEECGGGQVCAAGVCGTGCLIDGASYPPAATSPDDPCLECDPTIDPRAWSPRADGAACGAGLICDALACVAGCFIDGALRAPGSIDPATPCRRCAPEASTTAWTPLDDGTGCGDGAVCSAAACAPGCFVDGAVRAPDSSDPSSPCRACAPSTSTTEWTTRPDGERCGDGAVCDAGSCRSGCFVEGAFRAPDALDPANECRACAPAASTTAYSPRPDGAACGAAQFCTAGACGPTWHGSTPSELVPVYGGSAAPTHDGRIVVFGAFTSGVGFNAFTQIYSPASGTVRRGASAPYVPYRSCAVTARDGRIYLIGGSPSGAPVPTVAVYDPMTDRFVPGPLMPFAAHEHACALGADGRIYVFATQDAATPGALYVTSRTMILDPATQAWTTGAPMLSPRQRATAVTLPDGRIAVTGGNRGYIFGAISTLNEIYSPAHDTWTTAAPMPVGLHWNVAALRSDGRMIVTGGVHATTGDVERATHVFDPVTNAWALGTPVTGIHYAAYAATASDQRVYVLTGRGLGAEMSSVVDALY
ncbi:hypothetical protein DB32_007609 [Sandaracinus amylolyticus]|uniref:Uncharacterized protein n=1 Tax=Sandaracinus amylolyticus TaxID=927083 RepID=A0A0F6YLY8_9BACT|nr:hypothetical protein DB32_007609 [Sandaracinus amylolyticus]